VMGDHATRHLPYESPLRGDTQGVAQAVSDWTRRSEYAVSVADDGAAAIRAARSKNGQVTTLILPADTAWDPGSAPVVAAAAPPLLRPSEAEIAAAAAALQQPGAAILLGGAADYGAPQVRAAQIAEATGARLLTALFTARVERGSGAPVVQGLPYPVDAIVETLKDVRQLVVIGTTPPVAFFAYPGKPSLPTPPEAHVMELARPEMDLTWTLDALAEALGVGVDAPYATVQADIPPAPMGALSLETLAQALAHTMPDQTIVANESVTAGAALLPALAKARRHDLLGNCGGSIGQGLPSAVGAAVACPDRPVLCLTGDGSAMYTLQSLWTMAREQLNVTVVVIANKGYQILHGELANVGVTEVGRNARAMFDIVDPELDWVALAQGHGVEAHRPETAEALTALLTRAYARTGPCLIEVRV